MDDEELVKLDELLQQIRTGPLAPETVARRLVRMESDEARSRLIAMLRDPSPSVRAAAAFVLGAWGGVDVIDHLMDCFECEREPSVRVNCLLAFGATSGGRARRMLVAATRDESCRVVVAACIRLVQSRRRTGRRAFKRLLQHEDWTVRYHACEGLLMLQSDLPDVVRALELLVQEPPTAKDTRFVESWNASFDDSTGVGQLMTATDLLRTARRLEAMG